MDFGDILLVGASMGALAPMAQMYEQNQAAQSQEAALGLEGKQQQLSYTEQQVQNYAQTTANLDASIAQSSATGFAPQSASFNAIGRNIYNQGAVTAGNIDAAEQLSMSNIALEQQNVQNQFMGSVMGDFGQFASQAAFAGRFMPT